MFTQQELEFIKALVESMRGQGYDYYIARTVTEDNNSYDVEIVFSTVEIRATGLYGFADCDGVIYRLDSSSGRSDLNTKLTVSNFSGSYTVPSREFVYTNATFQGGTIQPDIRQLGGKLSESNQAGFYLLALFLLVVVAIKLFRAG
jgi:hypothetical protein